MSQSKNIFVAGNIVDVVNRRIYKGTLEISSGKIAAIHQEKNVPDVFILPGLIDAHIHIESSMLIPSEFARIASVHGTVATVSDPHEIANVLGIKGVNFMIANGKKVAFKFNFGAPSCVPATDFESSGAIISTIEIEKLLKNPEIKYLTEMMNFPGVIYNDPKVHAKLTIAKKSFKPVDGHAPGLRGDELLKYVSAGISTDHECLTIEEAIEKISLGMKVIIREGSAAKDFEELYPLIHEFPNMVMLCSDDLHPDDLIKGHINLLVRRALLKGLDIFDVLRSCTLNPVNHYSLNVGLLQPKDEADFIIIDNLQDFNILETYIQGEKVAEKGISNFQKIKENPINVFNANTIDIASIEVLAKSDRIRVIKAINGLLITKSFQYTPKIENGKIYSNIKDDVLKIVVLNRYKQANPTVGFIQGFGFNKGAIASSISHDSHNIIAVGVCDKDIAQAINAIIHNKGGISVVFSNETIILPLPYAGLMSGDDGSSVSQQYKTINVKVKEMGTLLDSPFMTLSFMALLVIPELKLSDRSLFDGINFEEVSLFIK